MDRGRVLLTETRAALDDKTLREWTPRLSLEGVRPTGWKYLTLALVQVHAQRERHELSPARTYSRSRTCLLESHVLCAGVGRA